MPAAVDPVPAVGDPVPVLPGDPVLVEGTPAFEPLVVVVLDALFDPPPAASVMATMATITTTATALTLRITARFPRPWRGGVE